MKNEIETKRKTKNEKGIEKKKKETGKKLK